MTQNNTTLEKISTRLYAKMLEYYGNMREADSDLADELAKEAIEAVCEELVSKKIIEGNHNYADERYFNNNTEDDLRYEDIAQILSVAADKLMGK